MCILLSRVSQPLGNFFLAAVYISSSGFLPLVGLVSTVLAVIDSSRITDADSTGTCEVDAIDSSRISDPGKFTRSAIH